MPCEAAETLSYHKGKKRCYKWMDGNIKDSGRTRASFENAWSEYLDRKRNQENPIESIEMVGGRVNAVKLKSGAEPRQALSDQIHFFDRLAQEMKRAEHVAQYERDRQPFFLLDWANNSLKTQAQSVQASAHQQGFDVD